MFHDGKAYNKINKIHERALRIMRKDSTSNFRGLLIKGNSVSVRQSDVQPLLIEIYITINIHLSWQKYLSPLLCRIIFVAALILLYPKPGQTCMALILSGLLVKIMAECAERNQRVPNIRNFQKKY